MKSAREIIWSGLVSIVAVVAMCAPTALGQQWVTPAVTAPRVQQVIFNSAAVGAPVSYHVYTPPVYDSDPTRRFPVLYWLHGSNSVLTGIAPMSAWFDSAIANGRIQPMIVVFPNGLPLGMWCNWANGAARVEDMVIQDLIPEVDGRLRTIASRQGRIIEGFSMGGYGAARMGFRHNQLFGGISMLGAGPLQLDFLVDVPGSPVTPQQRAQIYRDVYGNDQAIYLAQSPWMLAEVHRDALVASVMPIRQLIGGSDFSLPANVDFHERLNALSIPNTFFNPPGVGHDALGLFNAYGESNWAFYHAVFGSVLGTCPTCVPLNDLGPGLYLGQYSGGLYPDGQSVPPLAHQTAFDAAARAIRPLDAGGRPTPDGLVGFITLGMSNATMEFGATEVLVDADQARNARVVMVNTALGSHPIELINNPNEDYWTLLDTRLAAAGLTRQQVQVLWIKQAFNVAPTTAFPAHASALQEQYVLLVNLAKQRFPNLRLAYLSSRIYGGYSTNPQRNEPLSYETGFAVKWLVEAQITGSDPRLRHIGEDAPAPVLAWGPYVWANGTTPRSDGLTWQLTDFETDRIHPNDSGRSKVAQQFMSVFTDAQRAPWYRRLPTSRVVMREVVADATLDAQQPNTPFGMQPSLRIDQGRNVSLLRFDLAGITGRVLHAKLYVRRGGTTSGAVGVRGPVASNWVENTVTWSTAPNSSSALLLASLPDEDDFGGTASTWSFDVSSVVRSSLGGLLTLAMTSQDQPGDFAIVRARESGAPARLVLLIDFSDVDADGVLAIDDLYRQNQTPADTNGDGLINQSDLDDLTAWYRWYGIEDMTAGRR